VARGIAYLSATQQATGVGREAIYCGRFPRVFYLRYHGYRLYFPLLALARYRTASSQLAARSVRLLRCEAFSDHVVPRVTVQSSPVSHMVGLTAEARLPPHSAARSRRRWVRRRARPRQSNT